MPILRGLAWIGGAVIALAVVGPVMVWFGYMLFSFFPPQLLLLLFSVVLAAGLIVLSPVFLAVSWRRLSRTARVVGALGSAVALIVVLSHLTDIRRFLDSSFLGRPRSPAAEEASSASPGISGRSLEGTPAPSRR